MTSPSKEKNRLLSAALAYADRGWSVFPLRPREKAPITKKGFLDGSTDRSQILQWWQFFPEANIGLATGSPFDVLDIDGPDSVPALRSILGRDFRHVGPVAKTGREGKGIHLYFAALADSRNRAGLLGGKLDYRGTGGYVVAPPSIHPSGRVYEWDANRDYHTELPTVPDTLREVVLKDTTNQRNMQVVRLETKYDIKLEGQAATALFRPPIEDIVRSLQGEIVRRGANYFTNCFFHDDSDPSMQLYEDNSFYCHGCEAHGDSFDLQRGQDMTGRNFGGG